MRNSINLVVGSRGDTLTGIPHTVDFRITGACQLRCEWCWGPERNRKEGMAKDKLIKTLERLAVDGTEQIVFSGGEPTLSNMLAPGIKAARENGLKVTLSTNGINTSMVRNIIGQVDDLGIPIDGSTPEVNEAMRTRSERFDAWQRAVGTIVLAQRMNNLGKNSNIAITSRTVIAKPNLDDIYRIPAALQSEGVDIEGLRMKFYQVEPFGPRVSSVNFNRDWAVTDEEAQGAVERAKIESPQSNITLQLYKSTVGRYFLVDPSGNATGTDENESGEPLEIAYGNIVHDYEATIEAYRKHQKEIASRIDQASV